MLKGSKGTKADNLYPKGHFSPQQSKAGNAREQRFLLTECGEPIRIYPEAVQYIETKQ